MKVEAKNRARWQRVATLTALVCVAAQLSAVTAFPAPPGGTGGQPFLDIATPPPITEDELHNMVEQLLMEAYGDEYEPPPPRLKANNTPGATTLTSTTSSNFGSSQTERSVSDGITESLLLIQQQQKMAEIQRQREKLHKMQKQLHQEEQQQQQQEQEQQQQLVQLTSNSPITKASLIAHQQLKQNPRNIQSSVPVLDKPSILHGQSITSSNPLPTTRPTVSLQPPVTETTKPRGIPTPDELQEALVFQQENQPGVLIVDRRKKSKAEKSKGARQLLARHNSQARGRTPINLFPTTTTIIHTQTPPLTTKQLVVKRGRSPFISSTTTPLSSLINNTRSSSLEPARSLKRETKPEIQEGGNLASRNGRSPQQHQAQQTEKKLPVIESAKLLSHIVSEDMQPFHKVGGTKRQTASSSAPRPFTLPSPVNNPVQRQPQEQQKTLTVDIADEDLLMLQLLGSQLNQAARVQSTQNLRPSQPQSGGQAVSNNQQASLQFTMQPKRNNDDNRVIINLGNMANQLPSASVALPVNNFGGSSGNSIRSTSSTGDVGKAISAGNTNQNFASSTQKFNQVNGFDSDGRVTVGDLVMSLNGQNGIRVISLGDLRNSGNVGLAVTNNDADLLQQLRNAMISGNINTLHNQQLNVGVPLPTLNQGSARSNVGVPLPTLVQNNQNKQADTSNAGRQFDFLFGNENQNSQNTVGFNNGGSSGGGVINDLLFDASISVGRPGDAVPQSGGGGDLDDFFVNQNSASGGSALGDIFGDISSTSTGSVGVPLPSTTDQDAFPDTFSTTADASSTDTGNTVLEDNTDFEFGSYEDDFADLPAQPPNVFRTGISDIFFTKGQWIGTLLGGLFDVGSAIGGSVSKLFKKGSSETTTST